MTSAPTRDRANATVCTPASTRSANRSAVSATAERRRAVTADSASTVGRISGSHNPIVTAARGDPSWVTGRTGIPMRAAACAPGSATVADARTKVGFAR